MKLIKIVIDKNGNFKAEAENYHGPSCEQDITKILQNAGAVVESSENKPEYYQQEMTSNADYGNL